MKYFTRLSTVFVFLLMMTYNGSCKKDDPKPQPEPDVVARFTYAWNTADLRIVTFTNTSQNYESVSWDFGDNSPVSTNINPVHVYPGEGVYTVKLTATSPSGVSDEHTEVVTISIPVNEIGKAEAWLTKGDKTKLLNKESDITIYDRNTETYPVIDVDTSLKYQSMEGFGAALTGSSAYLFHQKLDAAARAAALTDLFDPGEGIGVSYLRLTIGASDFSLYDYTYDDVLPGQTDFNLEQFTLEDDQADLIPVLKEIVAIAPEINLMGSPWSPPAWMKTNGNQRGGQLKTDCYDVYARYFVKYILAMQNEGIAIDAITPQNEPLYFTANYPCMEMQPGHQLNFIKNHLGPKFAEWGITAKIIIYDHNWDNTNYAISILNDATARNYISGSAFHAYAGEVGAMSVVHNAHPDKGLYFTEISGGSWATNFADNLMWNMQNIFIGTALNWSKTALLWNLALDENDGPQNNGCSNCRGVITINSVNGQITKNEEYYSIGHFSKFVRPGAFRVSLQLSQSLSEVGAVAFLNPDGTKALVVCNYGNGNKSFTVKQHAGNFSYTIPSKSVVSIIW